MSLSLTLCLSEAAARLKQLELESSPLLGTPKNVNVNMAMNNQVSFVHIGFRFIFYLFYPGAW